MPLVTCGHPDNWYVCDEEVCPDCKKTERDLDNAKESFDMLVKILYSKDEPINPHTLEMVLEDMRAYCGFDSDYPEHLPTVQRVGKDVPMLYELNKELM